MTSNRLRFRFALMGVVVALGLPQSVTHGQTLVAAIPTGPSIPVLNPTQIVINHGNNKAYVSGDNGNVAVLDASTNKRIGAISLGGAIGNIFANPVTNKIYIGTATSIVIVDSVTDTVLKTTPSPTQVGTMAYNPNTNRIYAVKTIGSPFPTLTLVSLDGDTLVQLSTVASWIDPGGGAAPQAPQNVLVLPGSNHIWGYTSNFTLAGGNTFLQLWDGATEKLLLASACGVPFCTNILPYPTSVMSVNPKDNSLWAVGWGNGSSQAGGGTGGTGPIPTPIRTTMTQIDGPLGPSTLGSIGAWGQFSPTGFDPFTGNAVGWGVCVPLVQNPGFTGCNGTTSGTYMLALKPLDNTGINPLVELKTASTCGFPLGYDSDLNYVYSQCSGYGNGPIQKIGLTKFDFSQTPSTATFPPSIQGQFLTQINTYAAHIPQAVNSGVIDHNNHLAFFPFTGDNAVVSFDPVGQRVATELLASRPADIAANSAGNSIIVVEDTSHKVTTINGGTNTTTAVQATMSGAQFIGASSIANQFALGGISDFVDDPTQVGGAFLYDASGALVRPMPAAASGGIIFSPPTYTGRGIAVNPATNIAYYLNQSSWFTVDLNTGQRLFTGTSIGGPSQCTLAGIAVNSKTNQYFVSGQCPASQNGDYTLGVFDGTANALLRQVALPVAPFGVSGGYGRMAVNPNTNRLYIEQVAQTVAPVQGPPLKIVQTYDGATLIWIKALQNVNFPLAINSVTNRMYAASTTSAASMVVVDTGVDGIGRTDVQLATVANLQPTAIAINETTGIVYVASNAPLPAPGAPAPLVGGNPPAPTGHGGVNVFREDPLPSKFSLSGSITRGGSGLGGVTVNISSVAPGFLAGSTSVKTDASGAFSLAGLLAGQYSVSPVMDGFFFTPATQTINITTSNVAAVNFTATPVFKISGRVVDTAGNPITISSMAIFGPAPLGGGPVAADGTFTLTVFSPGTYTLAVTAYAGPAVTQVCCFLKQQVTVTNADLGGILFAQVAPITTLGLTFSPGLVGPGVVSTATATIDRTALGGGVQLQVQGFGTNAVKFPATVTIPSGSTSTTFSVQGNSINGSGPVTLRVVYSGELSLNPMAFDSIINVAPADTLHVTNATWSRSTQTLKVSATSTNAQTIINVLLASGNVPLGTMVNQGNGNYSFQTQFTAGAPASVNLKSALGGATGQGVTVLP